MDFDIFLELISQKYHSMAAWYLSGMSFKLRVGGMWVRKEGIGWLGKKKKEKAFWSNRSNVSDKIYIYSQKGAS